jgi:hypothetical protein
MLPLKEKSIFLAIDVNPTPLHNVFGVYLVKILLLLKGRVKAAGVLFKLNAMHFYVL